MHFEILPASIRSSSPSRSESSPALICLPGVDAASVLGAPADPALLEVQPIAPIWHYGNMAMVKTTLSLDESLMRQVRVRAARTGRRDSDVLEEALRQGLGVLDRIRAKANLSEEAAYEVAHAAVQEARLSYKPVTPGRGGRRAATRG